MKFSFFEIYGNAIAEMMVDKVKDLLYKFYNFYTSIHSPNVQKQSRSERTELESYASDPYVMVHSRYERFLQVEQSVGCRNELEKYLAENCDGRKDVNFEILEWWRDNCPLMVQNLVCSQNWLQAIVPISHRQSRDDVEALEEELLELGNMFKF